MRILVVNAGSSSLKLDVVEGDERVAGAELDAPHATVDADELDQAVSALGSVDAVGHRIVHGGTRFTGPVRLDDRTRLGIAELADLAPLHQRKSLAALDAVGDLLPDAPAVACFDTAFHSRLPAAARTYALPAAWRERWDLRRYGFHGLSVAYASRRTAQLLDCPVEAVRIIVCHLGAGASVTAVDGGRSVDTTMGFTPLEGLAMATRSGSIDPGLLLWLQEHGDLDPATIEHALEHESGLLGLAGSSDMREIIRDSADHHGAARLALDVFLHRLRAGIATMAAAMDGFDVLVFTGGVGEHAPEVRSGAAAGLRFLGVALDDVANRAAGQPDRDLSSRGAAVRTLVLAAREDLQIAMEAEQLLGR